MILTEPAPAKLNLALHVRARRPDGYHALETLFAFCTDGDALTMQPADRWSLRITGPFAAGLEAGPTNLVVRAALAFDAQFGGGTSYTVTLDKRLPVASGIGGGSADAAAMLRLLARERGVRFDDARLMALAGQLGSDVPACLDGRATIGMGRGERLTPVAGLGNCPALLVNPGVAVPTGPVFAGWDGADRGPLPPGDAWAIARQGRNDLTESAIAITPVIATVLECLGQCAGAGVVRMSGSGATCFALFGGTAARDDAANAIATAHPGWWLLPTQVV